MSENGIQFQTETVHWFFPSLSFFLWFLFFLFLYSIHFTPLLYSPNTNRSKIGVSHRIRAVSSHVYHCVALQRNLDHNISQRHTDSRQSNGLSSLKCTVNQYTMPSCFKFWIFLPISIFQNEAKRKRFTRYRSTYKHLNRWQNTNWISDDISFLFDYFSHLFYNSDRFLTHDTNNTFVDCNVLPIISHHSSILSFVHIFYASFEKYFFFRTGNCFYHFLSYRVDRSLLPHIIDTSIIETDAVGAIQLHKKTVTQAKNSVEIKRVVALFERKNVLRCRYWFSIQNFSYSCNCTFEWA